MSSEETKKTKKAAPKKAAEKVEKIVKKAVAKKAASPKKAAPKKAAKASTDSVSANFIITYGTSWGQSIFIAGNHPALGNNHHESALKLTYIDNEHWGAEVKLNKDDFAKNGLEYFYIIQNEDGSTDQSAPYFLHADDFAKSILVKDAWNFPGFIQNAFSTKVFEVLSDKISASKLKNSSKKGTHKFKVASPELQPHHAIFMLGNSDDLGGWDAGEIILLSPELDHNIWSANVNIANFHEPIAYKYGIYDLDKKAIVVFEEGENRTLSFAATKAALSVINDGFLRSN